MSNKNDQKAPSLGAMSYNGKGVAVKKAAVPSQDQRSRKKVTKND